MQNLCRHNYEIALQKYLCRNNGKNLARIEPDLKLIEAEHRFPGGRIDILARKEDDGQIVAIELKAQKYNTQNVCAQLLNYENYIAERGKVYFIAPKIKKGIFSTMKTYADSDRLQAFEYKWKGEDCFFDAVNELSASDNKKWNFGITKETDYEDLLLESLPLLIRSRPQLQFAKVILDSKIPDYKKLNMILQASFKEMAHSNILLKSIYKQFSKFI